MFTKSLTAMAILMTAASLSSAQRGPGRQSLQSNQAASLSYRSQGGIVGTKTGLDVDSSGSAYAFTESNGLVSRSWGQVNSFDLQQLQAAADAFFASRSKSLSRGSGTLSHTLMRQTDTQTQWFETFSPKGKAASLIQMLQQAHADVMKSGVGATPPIRYMPNSKQSRGAKATGAGAGGAASKGMSGSVGTLNGGIYPILPRLQSGKPSMGQGSTKSGGSGLGSKGSGQTGSLGSVSPASKGTGGGMSINDRRIIDRGLSQGRTPSMSGGSVMGGSGSGLGSKGSSQTGSFGAIDKVSPASKGTGDSGQTGKLASGLKKAPRR